MKSKIRSEHIDAFNDGREDEIPAELLDAVAELGKRQAVKPVAAPEEPLVAPKPFDPFEERGE